MAELKDAGNVLEWAESKGIFDKGTAQAQAYKMLEEAMELHHEVIFLNDGQWATADARLEAAKLELGDVLVTLIILSNMLDIDMDECLSLAYNKISKRKGKMIDGQFVKESE